MSDARHWLTLTTGLGAVLGTASACPLILDPNHCANMDANPCGDLVCDPCTPSSQANGCVAEALDQDPSVDGCQLVGGGTSTDPTETDPTATTTIDPTLTTTIEPDTTATDTIGDTETTTGPPVDCAESDGELGAACPTTAPFCVDGTCVPCSNPMADCAAVDAAGDVCDASGACVVCNAEDASACVGDMPICDAANTCVACTAHDQCAGGAGCHLFEGSCLSEDTVYMVDPDAMNCGMAGEPSCNIGSVLTGVVSGSDATIRLAGTTYLGNVAIPANTVIAIIANDDATLQADNGGRTVEVLANATLYLADLRVQNNSEPPVAGIESAGDVRLDGVTVRFSGPGIVSTQGRVFLRDSRVINNTAAGVSVAGTQQVTLINTIIAGNGTGSLSPQGFVSTGDTPFEIVYSTIAENLGNNGGAINAPDGVGVVRNSIVVSNSLTNSVGLGDITITNSVIADTDFESEMSNVPIMASVAELNLDVNYEIGTGSVAEGVAVWMTGDPLSDINGQMRPGVDGDPDAAGANIP